MNNPISKTYYNLLLKNYPQYEVLRQELLKLFFRKALVERGYVDCYVNLNSYLSSLYKRSGEYVYDEPLSVTSSIINFAAHLRAFFASRFSMRCRIFFIYGNTRPESAYINLPEYDAHNTMDREVKVEVQEIIRENLNMLNILCPYIPEVYYIESDACEPAVIIRSIIKEQSIKGAKHARLIFSKDLYDYQLVATVPNTHLIRTKKTMQGDQTFSVSFFDFYKKLSKTLSLKNPIGTNISPELYSVYMTLAGCKDRNIKGIYNYPKSNTIISNLLNSGRILNGYNPSFGVSPNEFNLFIDTINSDESLSMILFNRFTSMDLIHQSNLFRMHPSYFNIEKSIIDLYDPSEVQNINNRYFKKYPLDLNVL